MPITSDLNMKSIVSTQMKGIPMDNAAGYQRRCSCTKNQHNALKYNVQEATSKRNSSFEFYNWNCS